MNDSAIVWTRQCAGHVGHDLESRRFVEARLLDDEVAQVPAGNEFEDEVGDAVLVVEFQKIDDVRVVGLGQQSSLLAESLEGLGSLRGRSAEP